MQIEAKPVLIAWVSVTPARVALCENNSYSASARNSVLRRRKTAPNQERQS